MARALPVVVVAVSAAGCAQLAGIDNTSGSGRTGNSVEVTRMSVGSTVVNLPLDLSGLPAQYLLSTDTAGVFDRVYAKPSGPGRWTKDLADAAPVEFFLPDVPKALPWLYTFPNQALKVLFAQLEHPDRSPAPPAATLTVTAPLDVAPVGNESFQVYTVGSWTSRALGAGTVGVAQIGPITYAFSTSTSLSGRGQLDSLTTQDAFFVLRYVGPLLTGVAEATPFNQTGTDSVTTAKMTQVMQDQKLDVKVSPPALISRYGGARPAVTGLAMSWSLVAAPGYRIASGVGPSLQSGNLAVADVGVAAMYGNPFVARDWHTIFTLTTSESRSATLMGPAGPLPVTLSAGMNQVIEPSPGFNLTLEAGLPVLISLDGKQLAADWSPTAPQVIPQPSKFVEVTLILDNTNATQYAVEVSDLLPDAAVTRFEPHTTFRAVTDGPRFELPPETFQVGHYYTLRVFCNYGGYPAIADGDFTNRQLPLSGSFLDSGVFQVVMP